MRIVSWKCGAFTAGYDGDNLRSWKAGSSGSKTYFVYDGAAPVLELDNGGSISAVNTFGTTGLLSRKTSSANTFYVFDEHGNLAQRTDGSGTILTYSLFDAFGTKLSTDTQSDPWGYGAQAGYYTDTETGLILCTHRYYDPAAGRWLNRDPIGYAGGINLYGYVGNRAVNGRDPSGHSEYAPGGGDPAGGSWNPIGAPPSGGSSFTIQYDTDVGCSWSGDESGTEGGGDSGGEASGTVAAAGGGGEAGGATTGGEIVSGRGDGLYSHIEDPGTVGPGKLFTPCQKKNIWNANQERNGGTAKCDSCGTELVPPKKSVRGDSPPGNEYQVDHIAPRQPRDPSQTAGSNSYSNAQAMCRSCNRAKSNGSQ